MLGPWTIPAPSLARDHPEPQHALGDDGKLDPVALVKEVEWVISQGVAGLLFPAVAGEQASLDPTEYRILVEAVAETAKRRVPMIVSVTSPDRETRRARAAVALRARARTRCCARRRPGSRATRCSRRWPRSPRPRRR
jgi:hypothetical protein